MEHTVKKGMRALMKERYGETAETVTQPKNDGMLKLKEHMLKKFNAAISALSLTLSDEEKTTIEAFLTREEVTEKANGPIRFCPTGHQFLKRGLHAEEIHIDGENGIYAILRPDMKGRMVLNICYPALDAQLRTREFMPIFKGALQDWVISRCKLQVKGTKVNITLPETQEITADKEFLEAVSKKLMASNEILMMAKAVGNSPVYNEIYTTAVVYGTDPNGNRTTDYLFTSDPEMHSNKMGHGCFEDFTEDLLQGKVEVFDIAIKLKKDTDVRNYRLADIDPDKPSLFLKKNAKGYRLLLYIPEEMMQEFLSVN